MTPLAEAALISTAISAVTGGTIAAAGLGDTPPLVAAVLWVASLATAFGVLWKFLHLGELLDGTRNFLKDYNGEPARPGFEARPGMPERLAKIERSTHETKGAMPAMVVALEELQRWAQENNDKIDSNGNKIDDVKRELQTLDQRVTDHRRRNEETAAVLRQDLERRALELENKLEKRNHDVDEKLNHLSDDLLRAQTYRAALHELGIAVESRSSPRDE